MQRSKHKLILLTFGMLACRLLNVKTITENLFTDDEIYSETNLPDFSFCEENAISLHDSHLSSKTSRQATSGLSQAVRPSNLTSKPLTGVYNLECIEKGSSSVETVICRTARPMTTYYNRNQGKRTSSLQLGYSNSDPVQWIRLNLAKYAKNSEIACSLFDYLFYITKEYREALNLVKLVLNLNDKNNIQKREVLSKNPFSHNESVETNWWWLLQQARCLYCLGLTREAECSIKMSLELNPSVESYTLFALIAMRFNQPFRALNIYDEGLSKFPEDIDLLTGKARIYQKLNNGLQSVALYKTISQIDAMNVESLASIAMYYFYEDQPEVSLKYYKRILHYGYESSELYNNLGLCTFFTHQYDLCFSMFNQAVALSDETNISDVYYNLSHVAINIGDLQMAKQCLHIAIVNDNHHSEAYNNLGVLEHKLGNINMAKELYRTSCQLTPDLFEPHHNLTFLTEALGEMHTTFELAKTSLRLFPNHSDLQNLLFRLKEHFSLA
ncbi:unnamed protein product [Trichobilharzia szidati]|nr:unnamed protein product [Trichobilharzia szidati]